MEWTTSRVTKQEYSHFNIPQSKINYENKRFHIDAYDGSIRRDIYLVWTEYP